MFEDYEEPKFTDKLILARDDGSLWKGVPKTLPRMIVTGESV